MCGVLLPISEAYTNINNYHSLRVCLVPGPVLSTAQTFNPEENLWVLQCSFFKLGACYPVKLISPLPKVLESQSWDPGPVCLTPEPVELCTYPGPERGAGRLHGVPSALPSVSPGCGVVGKNTWSLLRVCNQRLSFMLCKMGIIIFLKLLICLLFIFYWSIVVLISAVQQSDSVYIYVCVCVCVCIYIYIYIYSFSYSFPLWFIPGYWI